MDDAPMRALPDGLELILRRSAVVGGTFDAIALADVSAGHPLAAMAYWALSQSGLVSEFKLSHRTLIRFLRIIEAGYNNNPYHNSTHAAHVVQGVHSLLSTGGLRPVYADSMGALALYLAAVRG
jgi:hypothetical protein